jgi:hypothetical protein
VWGGASWIIVWHLVSLSRLDWFALRILLPCVFVVRARVRVGADHIRARLQAAGCVVSCVLIVDWRDILGWV